MAPRQVLGVADQDQRDAEEAGASVRPGWIPLLIVLALGVFLAFLFFSLRKQLGRIDIPEDDGPGNSEDPNGAPTS